MSFLSRHLEYQIFNLILIFSSLESRLKVRKTCNPLGINKAMSVQLVTLCISEIFEGLKVLLN